MVLFHILSNVIISIGRSNAINISEKLGLPATIISNARELYGAASAEINEVTNTTKTKLICF